MNVAGKIRTLYLVPHSHTDVGYSHDPLAALELHDRFLDRAARLCEETRGYPDGSRFRWTVEVFSSALHWWENRGEDERRRLCGCLQRGEIDIGARYLNGTELYSPEDVEWENGELERLVSLTGYRPRTAIQNDVNGFPLAFARSLAAAGVESVMMGLNTTMGHSPFPRCSAFRWDVGGGRRLLAWNGWIYNRIKTYCHLDELADKFHEALELFLASLPKDYPFDFAMTSATVGDNVGPFVKLPEQVRRFNERSGGLQLRIATFAEFAAALRVQARHLPTYAGHWPDFWTFGAGSMPQMVGMVRRAQRRLRLIERFREKGWANESGGSLTLGRARRALAYACEHTYDSHTSSGEECGSSDALRQKAQIVVDASTAETASMVLLRDHLAAMAATRPKEPVSVLVANPHDHALTLDYITDRKGMLAFACSRQPEHLFQFDREPTVEALEKSGGFGVRGIRATAGSMTCAPLTELARPETVEIKAGTEEYVLHAGTALLRLTRAPALSPVSWQPSPGVECLDPGSSFPPFALIEEDPAADFQVGGMKDMDPSDAAWNPALTFHREQVPAKIAKVDCRNRGVSKELRIEYAHDLWRAMAFRLDPRMPGTLDISSEFRFNADPARRAYYFALPLKLPGEGDCEYWADNCGTWFRAETDQLPGTCNSFYQACRGVAVSRGGHTLYIASSDSTLFQFGGFTFGQLPSTRLQRKKPFVALWIYNNYWGTNFPSYFPGKARMRFRLQWRCEAFDPDSARRLDETFDCDYITHPVA